MNKNGNLFRFVVVALAIILCIGIFAGCSKDAVSETKEPTKTEVSNSGDTTAPEENSFDKKLKLTFSTVDGDKAGINEDGSPAANLEFLYDKFNFEFDFVTLDWSNYIDQTRIWMTAGDAPDLVMLDIHFSRYPEYLDWVNEGLLRAYPDLSDYPNMQKTLDGMVTGKKFIVDDVLYAWPASLDLAKYNYRQISMPVYRRDWADAVGLLNENDEYTWDEWYTLVKTVIEKDPGGNGPGQTIGMMGVDWVFPVFFGPGGLSPDMLTFTKDDSGKWVWGPSLPETLEAVKLTRQMYDDGIIWKDQPFVNNADAGVPFNAGQAFSVIEGNITTEGLTETVAETVDANPGLTKEDIGVAVFKTPAGKVLCRQMPDQWSQQAMNATISDEKVDRWCSIVDYMVSDEGYYFRNIGVPEVDWTMDGDELKILWPENENGVQQSPYITATWNGTWPWVRAFGCNDGFDLISPVYPSWAQDKVTSLYERLNQDDVFCNDIEPDLDYFSGPKYDQLTQNVKTTTDVIIEMMLTEGDLEQEWNDWVASEMDYINEVLDELNASIG